MESHFNKLYRDDRILVLAIDDDPEINTLLSHLLQSAGYRTITAEDGSMGIAIARRYRPNIVILDLCMPSMDGYTVCEKLKSHSATVDIPVVFGTAVEPTDDVISRCFDVGATDFISKPFNRVNLLARIRVVLREQAERENLRRLALEDSSTGLGNRRQFIRYVDEAIRTTRGDAPSPLEAEEYPGQPTASVLVLADIDDLSTVNDRFGYEFGDELTLTLAHLMRRLVSQDCKVGRIGGGRFGLVLTASSRQRGLALSERLRRTFSSIVFDADSAPKHFTAGFGLASYHGKRADFDADMYLMEADIALYAAKQSGRNGHAAYWQLDSDALPVVPFNKRSSRARARRPTQKAFLGVVEAEASRMPSSDQLSAVSDQLPAEPADDTD